MSEITWLGITYDKLKAEVAERQGISLESAESPATKLARLAPALHSAFRKYWDDAEIDDHTEIEGFTARKLSEQTGFTPIAVFLDLDWLIRNPEAAKEAIAYGWDRIV